MSSCKHLKVGAVHFDLNHITLLDIYKRRWLFQWKDLDVIRKVTNLLV